MCYYCNQRGHLKSNCWKLQWEEKQGDSARPIALVKTKVNSPNDRALSVKAEDTADLTSPVLDRYKTFVNGPSVTGWGS